MTAYGMTLAFAMRNSVTYLCIQGRWNNFYVAIFYGLTLMITMTRMVFFFFWYLLLTTDPNKTDELFKLEMYEDNFSTGAFTLKAILGAF